MLSKYGIYFGDKTFVYAELTIEEGLTIKNHNGAPMGKVDNDGNFFPREGWRDYSAAQLEEITKICCSWRDAK